MATREAPRLRSLYRRFLRELPSRNPSMLANPSPVQKHVRSEFLAQTSAASSTQTSDAAPALETKLAAAEQYIDYLKAQRLYITLVERYNPGTNMSEENRVRLTARRVGMDLPDELKPFVGGGGGGGGEGKS